MNVAARKFSLVDIQSFDEPQQMDTDWDFDNLEFAASLCVEAALLAICNDFVMTELCALQPRTWYSG